VPDNLPSRPIDRAALDRIIRRAAELQAGEMDTGENMTEAELLKLGAEVGIDGRYLRQALYEDAAGNAGEARAVTRWFGPTATTASRVVRGEKAALDDALAHWMSDGEALSVKRRLPDRTVWERQKGFFAEMKRGLGVGGRNYHLARATDVTVAVAQLEDGYCHVELSANVSGLRNGAIGGAIGAGSALALAAGGVVALTSAVGALPLALLAVVPLGMAGVAPALTARMQRRRAAAIQLALEQVLDRLEHGEIRPKHREAGPAPFLGIADEIRRAITEGIEQSRRQRRRLPPSL